MSLVYAVLMLFDFDSGADGLQYVTDDEWIPELGDPLHARRRRAQPVADRADDAAVRGVGAVDLRAPAGASRVKLFAFHMGLAETAVLGAFMAQDLILFVLFFDLMLVPFYFLVGQWGGPDRVGGDVQARHLHARRLAADARGGGRDRRARRPGGEVTLLDPAARDRRSSATSAQRWIFVAFALAFLIKMPAFPFHGWMPDGYRNMPLPALAVFSAVLSKVAAYGFLRDRAAGLPGRARGLPD